MQQPDEEKRPLREPAGRRWVTPLSGGLVDGTGDDLAHRLDAKVFVERSDIGIIGREHPHEIIPERRYMPFTVLDGHVVNVREAIGSVQNAWVIP